ncbi:Aste57867_19232 [Aphanomyces stellatus]|uniref:Aste57867_15749 protein n=1 Tax=Aphanomyces stellatus TaxID=120398 RepID=A0A485L3T4_9STRA|nr:hypothetical protein As57867_019168 [Aphanomyces stellatus]KAF0693272.1 hypothetical protein As57867_015693 [Aphanomyces stellatus]VFT92538.1 Aste57867_15749 [Aphanomyces stellatus]VFT95953.1 Aste57867_19232 [Aphanomyces stellatus]
MKKAKSSAAEFIWLTKPVEIIACFISDPEDLLDYLIALEPTNRLGDLVHLLDILDQADRKEHIWPTLQVTSHTVNNPALRAVVKYYSQILLSEACDYSWLDLAPSARVHLMTCPATQDKNVLANWYKHLTRLPISRITWTSDSDEDLFLEALPHLPHLKGLRLATRFSSMKRLLDYVSTSKLKEFDTGRAITSYNDDAEQYYTHLTTWLRAQPVEVLSFDMKALAKAGDDIAQAFFSALAQSTSLTTLTLPLLNMHLVRRYSFCLPKSVRTLNLRLFSAGEGAILAGLIRNSNLEDLHIPCSTFSMGIHFPLLFKSLPTSLKTLDLSECQLTSDDCHALGEVLPSTSIENLDLSANNVGDEGLGFISQTLQASSLHKLNINDTGLTALGVAVLIQAALTKQEFFIRMERNDWGDETKNKLRALAQRGNTHVWI